jgi:hypothetical protein
MSKKALFPTLSASPFTTISCAPPTGRDADAHGLEPSQSVTWRHLRGAHGVEATRNARGSEDSAKAWAWGWY